MPKPPTPSQAARKISGHSAYSRNLAAPLRNFLHTEISGAIALLAAAVAALIWANAAPDSYASFWHTDFSLTIGDFSLGGDLHWWVNDGLMALFFLVVGLEVRREFDMGELRERRRVAVPLIAAIGGMLLPVAIYFAFTAGSGNESGWGIVMPTDTAFALGLLALLGRSLPPRIRVFMLTVVIADDVGVLLVIAFAYSSAISLTALAAAGALALVAVVVRWWGPLSSRPYEVLGILAWIATVESGIHPTIAGVVIGLAVSARPPAREDLERATAITRIFREQPSAELARSANLHVKNAVSANERLQRSLHPWTSFVIVPIFALANAGLAVSGELLSDALTSSLTIGIICALVLGKLFGIGLFALVAAHPRLGRLPSPVEMPPVFAAAALSGIGFTLSLFIAEIAFEGQALAEAKIGILVAAVLSAVLGAVIIAAVSRFASGGGAVKPAAMIEDLAVPVKPNRDHILGPIEAPVTVIEYGDYECPFCGRAETAIRGLLEEFDGQLTYVWRHLPLQDVHPRAQFAAEAAEAAALQGKFWEMHDELIVHQNAIDPPDLRRYAAAIGLDTERFWEDLRSRKLHDRVIEDVDSADASGVAGTPSFFINGRRYDGAYDLASLTSKVRSVLASLPDPVTGERAAVELGDAEAEVLEQQAVPVDRS